ncbi:glycogen synthase [Patescibacteria group bacterium]|nr:glycogen synthase [Patescibacteria group bacterium]
MKVLFATWELDPFFKIGGLGDVARSLPGALRTIDVDIRTITPYYKAVKMGRNKKNKVANFYVEYAGKKRKVEVWQVTHPYTKVPAYFLKNERYLDKVTPMETWGFFDKAVIEAVKQNVLNFSPEIIHVNDQHCGLIPLLVKTEKLHVNTILTIHNLAYQGKTSVDVIQDAGIDPKFCKILMWEIKSRRINFLQEAILHADIITTVSPTYAKEIICEEYGQGLNEILKGREGKIFGILNGIDIDWRNTTHDKSVKFPYNSKEKKEGNTIKYYHWKDGKKLNKLFLQKKLGLKQGNEIPVISFIGRLDAKQKGLDIMHAMLRRTTSNPEFEFVLLGDGDKDWEERYTWFSAFYPKYVSCNFRFDETLAHQIYAASDFIIIPSLFEPCGLIQMISMLFGTLPIAHKTGGLRDSIKDDFNGFLFDSYTSEALEKTVQRALKMWHGDKSKYHKMVENAIKTDFSWTKSAKEYLSLYQQLKQEKL